MSEERKVHRFWVGESLGVGIRGKGPLLRAPEGREAGWQVELLHNCKWRKALGETFTYTMVKALQFIETSVACAAGPSVDRLNQLIFPLQVIFLIK